MKEREGSRLDRFCRFALHRRLAVLVFTVVIALALGAGMVRIRSQVSFTSFFP